MQSKLSQNQIERLRERYRNHPLLVACSHAFGCYNAELQALLFAPEEIFLESAIILDKVLTEPEDAIQYVGTLWNNLKTKIRYWNTAPQDDLDKVVGAIFYVVSAVLCQHYHQFFSEEVKELMLETARNNMKSDEKEEQRFIRELSNCAEELDKWLSDYIKREELLSEEIIEVSNQPTSSTSTFLILSNDENAPLPSFGFGKETQKYWADVYGQLVRAAWIKKAEVSQLEFVYIMCNVGTQRFLPIQWHGSTGALADIIRRKLQDASMDRWKVSKKVFLDKNNKPLPEKFETTKAPGLKTSKKIDKIFN